MKQGVFQAKNKKDNLLMNNCTTFCFRGKDLLALFCKRRTTILLYIQSSDTSKM